MYKDKIAEWLHDKDNLGRAIHEDAFYMQVPSWSWSECYVCLGIAEKFVAFLMDQYDVLGLEKAQYEGEHDL